PAPDPTDDAEPGRQRDRPERRGGAARLANLGRAHAPRSVGPARPVRPLAGAGGEVTKSQARNPTSDNGWSDSRSQAPAWERPSYEAGASSRGGKPKSEASTAGASSGTRPIWSRRL